MLKDIKFRELLRSKTAAGVEVIISDNENFKINLTILHQEKSSIEIKTAQTNIENISNLKQSISSDIPVNLVLNGKGIIHKIVSYEKTDDDNSLLQKVFPNANPNEFYIEKEPSADNNILVSIIRKSVADDILKSFNENEIYIVSASLGPFCVSTIYNLLNGNTSEGNHEINIAHHKLTFIDGKINEFQTNIKIPEEKIPVGNELLDQNSVIPFAAAFQYLYAEIESLPTKAPSIMRNREEFINEKIFKTMGWIVLALFFIILMVNFFLFNSFSVKYTELEQKVFQNKDRLFYFENLKKEVEEKQFFLKKSGLMQPSRTSFFADQLAIDLPKSLQLIDLNINPFEKKAGKNKGITFMKNSIIIAGTCKKSTELNEWIKILKDYSWVNEASIINYAKTSANKPGEFKMEILIH